MQRLSRLLGHPLQLTSRPGKGSCFRVVLPAAPAIARPLQTLPEFTRTGPRPAVAALPQRILVIDDESDIRQATVALLRGHVQEVQAVATETEAAQALTRAQTAGADIQAMVCDYRLGDGADGLEAGLRLQRELAPQAMLLLITGETAPERLQRVRDAGVPVLFKPVNAQELIELLAHWQQPAVDIAL